MAHSGHQKIIDWGMGQQHNRAQLIYSVYGAATAIGQQRGEGESRGESRGGGGRKRGGDIVAGGWGGRRVVLQQFGGKTGTVEGNRRQWMLGDQEE